MKEKDKIETLFSDKFRKFEAKVDPETWSKISSQLNSQPALGIMKRLSFGVKTTAILSISVLIVFSARYLLKKEEVIKRTAVNNEIIINKKRVKVEPTPFMPIKEKVTTTPKRRKKKEEKGVKTKQEEIVLKKEEVQIQEKRLFVDTIKKTEKIEPHTPQKETTPPVVLQEEEIKSYTIEKLPNVFTPNNDGNNDFFMIKTTGLQDFNITIINDKNNIVYQSNDADFIWNGLDLYQNESKPGRYIYYITAKDREGKSISKYSPLTIRR